MRKTLNLILLCITTVFNHPLFCQKDSTIHIGHIDHIQSKILNENREIMVHVPPNSSTTDSFPVLILFDGDALFTKTIGILNHLSGDYGNNKCPKMIIVGIKHRDRMKDLFPSVNESNPFENDKFSDFLEKELIPYLDQKYPTAPYRLLVGHSVGGLRVANSVVYNSKTFNAFIALDPSLGHDMNKWSFRADSALKGAKYSNKSMFVAMAQTMPVLTDTAIINKDNSGDARHMRAIMRFCYGFKQYNIQGMDFNWKYYPNERHAGVTFLGLYDGLNSIFSWYEFNQSKQIYDSSTSTQNAVAIVENHYQLISEKMGYKITAPESFVNNAIDNLWRRDQIDKAAAFAEFNCKNYPNSESATNYLGYLRIEQNRLNEALILFQKNTNNFPLSLNAWDSYGECLKTMGRKKEAIDAYKKVLEINPKNKNAAKMIEELNGKK
jgi:predicted alpha/beta superfamily hydrolase